MNLDGHLHCAADRSELGPARSPPPPSHPRPNPKTRPRPHPEATEAPTGHKPPKRPLLATGRPPTLLLHSLPPHSPTLPPLCPSPLRLPLRPWPQPLCHPTPRRPSPPPRPFSPPPLLARPVLSSVLRNYLHLLALTPHPPIAPLPPPALRHSQSRASPPLHPSAPSFSPLPSCTLLASLSPSPLLSVTDFLPPTPVNTITLQIIHPQITPRRSPPIHRVPPLVAHHHHL